MDINETAVFAENSMDMFTNRPVSLNEHNNLLQIEEHMYILDDVQKPNVFRNMFPYSEIPKIPFNDRIVPQGKACRAYF